jgi:hypothetical protein
LRLGDRTGQVCHELLSVAHAALKVRSGFVNQDHFTVRMKWLAPGVTETNGDEVVEVQIMPLCEVIRSAESSHYRLVRLGSNGPHIPLCLLEVLL